MFNVQLDARPQTNSLLLALFNSKYNFHLTGSHYFGGFTPDSDWDFFVENDPNIISMLNDLGFIEPTQGLPGYEHARNCDIIVIFAHDDIHVQVVNNVSRKIEIQNILKNTARMSDLKKHQRTWLWRTAYQFSNNNLISTEKYVLSIILDQASFNTSLLHDCMDYDISDPVSKIKSIKQKLGLA